ncbi:hypothetical protein Taro_001381 [Colocasia esculenta]|uniref:Uncharacterized protein n=1 Tax=Colocasia esculenta TaxID=4460 RepID=A0A843TI21_COLES|nr:hypothetical protein [Colocasia esculenta]
MECSCRGLVQDMQTQTHTQVALQAQLEAQAQAQAQAPAPVPQGHDHGGPSIMERFKRMAPPSFKGESQPLLAKSWMREIEKIFRANRCAEEDKVSLATYMLQIGERDGAVPRGEEGFAEEVCTSVPAAEQEESGISVTAASHGGKQSAGSCTLIPRHQAQWQEGVSSLWKDTWWYGMLEASGKVLEVREQ